MPIIINDNNILDVKEHNVLSNNQIKRVGITNTSGKFGKKDINTTIDTDGIYTQSSISASFNSSRQNSKIVHSGIITKRGTHGSFTRIELFTQSGEFYVSKVNYPFLKSDDVIWTTTFNQYYDESEPRNITNDLQWSGDLPTSFEDTSISIAIKSQDSKTPSIMSNRGKLADGLLEISYTYIYNDTSSVSITDPSSIVVINDGDRWIVKYNIVTEFYIIYGGRSSVITTPEKSCYQIAYNATGVRFDIFTNSLELSTDSNPTWYGDSKSLFTFEQGSNSLYQIGSKSPVENVDLPQYVADTIIKCWRDGKETITLDVAIDDYYKNGEKVISIDENDDLPMLFEIGDQVIPFIKNDVIYEEDDTTPYKNFPERPISEKDGIAKTFIIYDVETVYDGVCHQIIKCIEATYHNPHRYLKSTNNITLPFNYINGTKAANYVYLTGGISDNYCPDKLQVDINGRTIDKENNRWSLFGDGDFYITYTPTDKMGYLDSIDYNEDDLYKLTITSNGSNVATGINLNVGDFVGIYGILNEDVDIYNVYINNVRQNIVVTPPQNILVDGETVHLASFSIYPNYEIKTNGNINIKIVTRYTSTTFDIGDTSIYTVNISTGTFGYVVSSNYDETGTEIKNGKELHIGDVIEGRYGEDFIEYLHSELKRVTKDEYEEVSFSVSGLTKRSDGYYNVSDPISINYVTKFVEKPAWLAFSNIISASLGRTYYKPVVTRVSSMAGAELGEVTREDFVSHYENNSSITTFTSEQSSNRNVGLYKCYVGDTIKIHYVAYSKLSNGTIIMDETEIPNTEVTLSSVEWVDYASGGSGYVDGQYVTYPYGASVSRSTQLTTLGNDDNYLLDKMSTQRIVTNSVGHDYPIDDNVDNFDSCKTYYGELTSYKRTLTVTNNYSDDYMYISLEEYRQSGSGTYSVGFGKIVKLVYESNGFVTINGVQKSVTSGTSEYMAITEDTNIVFDPPETIYHTITVPYDPTILTTTFSNDDYQLISKGDDYRKYKVANGNTINITFEAWYHDGVKFKLKYNDYPYTEIETLGTINKGQQISYRFMFGSSKNLKITYGIVSS